MPDDQSTPITVRALLQSASGLKAQRDVLSTKMAANRRLLRNLADSGMATPEESSQINALYPPHRKNARDTPAPGESTGEVGPPREDAPTADETPAQGPGAETLPESGDAPAAKPAAKTAPRK